MNLFLNIIVPSVILIKFSGTEYLGPARGLIIALSFPLLFGVYEILRNGKMNFFSLVGLISILLTGVFGLLSLDAGWIALKEAGVPFIIGVVVLLSHNSSFSVVRKLLFCEQVFDVEKIRSSLADRNMEGEFEKRLFLSTLMLAGSFFLSSLLNFILAKIMLVSEPGSEAFNRELGRMTAFSFPVIAVPSMLIMVFIILFILKSIRTLTGLGFSDVLSEKLKTEDGASELPG